MKSKLWIPSAMTLFLVGAGAGPGGIQAAQEDPVLHDAVVFCGDINTGGTTYFGPALDEFRGSNDDVEMGSTICGFLDNFTRANVEAPLFNDTDWSALGMWCRTDADVDIDENLIFTVLIDGSATSPSVTCTINPGEVDCAKATGDIDSISASAKIAIQVDSNGIGGGGPAGDAWCRVVIAPR